MDGAGGTTLIAVFAFVGSRTSSRGEEIRTPDARFPGRCLRPWELPHCFMGGGLDCGHRGAPDELARSSAPLATVFERITGGRRIHERDRHRGDAQWYRGPNDHDRAGALRLSSQGAFRSLSRVNHSSTAHRWSLQRLRSAILLLAVLSARGTGGMGAEGRVIFAGSCGPVKIKRAGAPVPKAVHCPLPIVYAGLLLSVLLWSSTCSIEAQLRFGFPSQRASRAPQFRWLLQSTGSCRQLKR